MGYEGYPVAAGPTILSSVVVRCARNHSLATCSSLHDPIVCRPSRLILPVYEVAGFDFHLTHFIQ